jgi:hypothetical protein
VGVGEGDRRKFFLRVVIVPDVMNFFALAEGHRVSDFAEKAVVERWSA